MALLGTQGTSSSCHGNAAASECQQHHREGDLQCSCQGTAVPGEQPGAGRSPRAVSQQAIHPFPSPPTAPAALTSMSCSVKATLQKEMYCQRWRHHGDCMRKMPLVCSHECQGCQATSEVGTQVPLPWRAALVAQKSRQVRSLDHAVPWELPVLPPQRDTSTCWSHLCKPSLSSTDSSLGKLSSGSSGVSAPAGRQ